MNLACTFSSSFV